MKLPAAIAGAALALQIAGAPSLSVARAYALVEQFRPDLIAQKDTKRGRQEFLRWQAYYAPDLSMTESAVYGVILAHRNYERGDAFPGYVRIAELSKCSPRTAKRAVKGLNTKRYLDVARRFRIVDRWEGCYRHDRTNAYGFPDGAPVEVSTCDGGAAEERTDAPNGDGANEPMAPNPPRPNTVPPRPMAPSAPPRPMAPSASPRPMAPSASPRPMAPSSSPRPMAPSSSPRPQPTSDPYWDIFESAFVFEHHAAYGKDSTPGSVRQDHLRDHASDVLNELASECVAWGRQPERGLEIEHLRVAEDLARRLARAWIRSPGRDNRHRDHGHPLGWMCCDLKRGLCDDAVEGWKRAQRRLLPKAAPAVRPDPTPPTPDEAAVRAAENTAIVRLIHKGVGFDEALRLARAEGAKMRTALGLAAPSLITPAAAEPREPLVEPADRATPE